MGSKRWEAGDYEPELWHGLIILLNFWYNQRFILAQIVTDAVWRLKQLTQTCRCYVHRDTKHCDGLITSVKKVHQTQRERIGVPNMSSPNLHWLFLRLSLHFCYKESIKRRESLNKNNKIVHWGVPWAIPSPTTLTAPWGVVITGSQCMAPRITASTDVLALRHTSVAAIECIESPLAFE
jgi:hypothetical protein